MEKLKDKIGMVVQNDGKELASALNADNLKHTGDFCFEADYKGRQIVITTNPQDDEETLIKITGINYADDKNAVRNVLITYRMIRGSEAAETCIDMPISAERYKELTAGFTPKNKAWHEIREALVTLTKLQGYEELGAWSIELIIEA
jgi:hypothetical protein